jgi:hypothetical protein
MPTLALTTTFSDLSVLTASSYNVNIWVPATANSSLEIINGQLASDNMDASWTLVSSEQVQPHQLCGGSWAAGTSSLDYFNEWFEGVTYTEQSLRDGRMAAIPGGGREFYLAEPAMVIFCWTIMWTNDSVNPSYTSEIYLSVDGTGSTKDGRAVKMTTHHGGDTHWDAKTQSLRKLTWWSGHKAVELAAGWHKAHLHVYAEENVPQTRVWARSFRVIWFKKPTTWG